MPIEGEGFKWYNLPILGIGVVGGVTHSSLRREELVQ